MSIVINILLAIHVFVSLLIIFLVLMQRPKSEGLGAAFGGGMTESVFGAGATNALQTITRYLGAIFFVLTLMLSWLYVKQTSHKSTIQQRLTAPTVIPAPPATPALEKKAETGEGKEGATPAPAAATPAPTATTPGPATATPAAAATPATAPAPTAATPAPAPAPTAATPAPAAATPTPAAATPAPSAAVPAPAAETPSPAASAAPATPAAATPAPPAKPAGDGN